MTKYSLKHPVDRKEILERLMLAFVCVAFFALFVRRAYLWYEMIQFYADYNMQYTLSVGSVIVIVFIIARLIVAIGVAVRDNNVIGGGIFLIAMEYLATVYRDLRHCLFQIDDYVLRFHIEPFQFVILFGVWLLIVYPFWPRRPNRTILAWFAFVSFEFTAIINSLMSYYVTYKDSYIVSTWNLFCLNRSEYAVGVLLGCIVYLFSARHPRHHLNRKSSLLKDSKTN